MEKRVAVINAVLENAKECQGEFNDIVASFQGIIYGRMGIPFHEQGISVISLTVAGTMDEINSFTGKIGKIPNIQVKPAISKKELD